MIKYLNKIKNKLLHVPENEEISLKDKKYIDNLPKQNPFGIASMLLGGAAFAFGPQYIIIPIVTLAFSLVTIHTFDRNNENNVWPFYVGIGLSVIGLFLYLLGYIHRLS